MKVGIMGGTFDPIHLGHLIAAERAREGMQLDEIWFIPVHTPPHKDQAPGAGVGQRWDMVCEAVKHCPHFRPVDIELKREGPSYTIETAIELGKKYPNIDFYYIIGADMVQYLPKWHKIDQLLQCVSFIGLKRAGYNIEWDQLSETIRSKVSMVTMPLIDISSTEIRERRSQNQTIRFLVPEKVYYYIEENRLYES